MAGDEHATAYRPHAEICAEIAADTKLLALKINPQLLNNADEVIE